MPKREICEKFDNLSEDELNAKNNKGIDAKIDVMTTVIKRCRGGKQRHKKNRFIQKKINDPRLSDC